MATLILRNVKGSPLTNTELDNNFSNITADIGVLSNLATTSNSNIVAAVNATIVNVGNLSLLATSNTSNLVAAINEAAATGSGGGLDPWQSVITTYTAVAQDRLLANTANAGFTITLPSSPTLGDEVYIADAYNFAARSCNVGRNGKTIAGAASDLEIDIQGSQVQLVYDGVSDWNVYYTTTMQTRESLGLGSTDSVTFASVTSGAYKDSTGNILLIKDESGTVIWGN